MKINPNLSCTSYTVKHHSADGIPTKVGDYGNHDNQGIKLQHIVSGQLRQ
jgi:hypothetical protein